VVDVYLGQGASKRLATYMEGRNPEVRA
jgi:hypothetical protein